MENGVHIDARHVVTYYLVFSNVRNEGRNDEEL